MKDKYRFLIIFSSMLVILFLSGISGCDNQSLPPNECASCPPAANAQPACVSGHCSFTCDEGFADCDADSTTGCEFDLDTDPSCSSCTTLGTVSGDQGSSTATVTGAGECWYRVYVSEDDTSPTTSVYLSATITLTPAAGTDYNLYGYCDNCTTSGGSSNNPGTTMDVVEVSWDEEEIILGIPSGSDSGRYVYIRVIFGSGNNCGSYTLTVTGNTNVALRTCYTL